MPSAIMAAGCTVYAINPLSVANKLRSLLREFYPAFLACFPDLTLMGARVALGLAPPPARARTVRKSSVTAALRRGGAVSSTASVNCMSGRSGLVSDSPCSRARRTD